MSNLTLEILTNRSFEKHPTWHLIHEWEDVLSTKLQIRIKKRTVFYFWLKFLFKLVRLLYPSFKINRLLIYFDDLYLRFFNKYVIFRVDIYPRSCSYLNAMKANVIPWIIDFDKNISISEFQKVYEGHKLILISSFNALKYLTNENCKLNLRHLPLSLPDKYHLSKRIYFKKRQFDLILPGRPNKKILQWLALYEKKNHEFEWLSYKSIDKRNFYLSNKGKEIDSRTREQYFDLLMNCKIAIYSTQGVDGNENSFDHITAKLFESVYAGCLMIGAYSETDESRMFGVGRVCPSIWDYNNFENKLTELLKSKRNDEGYKNYVSFLNDNKTSNLGETLTEVLRSNGFWIQ